MHYVLMVYTYAPLIEKSFIAYFIPKIEGFIPTVE
jgi:hypothetical protein